MAIAHEIKEFDIVELTERAYDAPAGARGGVLELYTPTVAMIEVLEPELNGAERIVFAPLDKLRLVKPAAKN
ncbi:MAG TPA: hypothetical protein VHF50_05630 [Solirubrobacterales bacterium]|nr:hypothetical protein [Solirubrobacterales bacterium]